MSKASDTEEEFFARQEAERLRKLSFEQQRAVEVGERERLRALHHMCCPKCGLSLQTLRFKDVEVDRCFACQGTWLDEGELERLAGKEAGFLHRVVGLFGSPEKP
ncbi:MAG: hypothetical protein EXR73_07150 [Myxococcales bacterium]|nr:hypothetical protein [Myxococcales bacterium]